MNLSELRELFEILEERDITEFELEEEGVKLRIRKGRAESVVSREALPSPATNLPDGNGRGAENPVAAEAAEESARTDGLVLVTAPMVGTFYRQSAPGAEPFTRKGEHVEKGQVLCIIEAMKLMNEIESELAGELVEVFVEDGQPVQYGDKLFAIRES